MLLAECGESKPGRLLPFAFLCKLFAQGSGKKRKGEVFLVAAEQLKGAPPDNVGDGTTRQFVGSGLAYQRIAVVVEPNGREHFPPQHFAQVGIGHRKVDHGLETAREGFVDIAAQVGGQHDSTREVFDALEQVGYFLVGMPVVGGSGRGALAEKSVSLIEKENPVPVFGHVEDLSQVFFGFADVFGNDHGKIDAVYIHAVLFADQSSHQGFPGTRGAVEERAVAGFQDAAQTPFRQNAMMTADPDIDFFYFFPYFKRKYHIAPFQAAGNAFGGKAQAVIGLIFYLGNQPPEHFGRQAQLPAQKRFAFPGAFEREDIGGMKPMLLLEQPDDLDTPLLVVAGQQKSSGLAGRQKAAVRKAFPAAEFGIRAIEVLIVYVKDVQYLGGKMGNQG